MMFVSHGYRDRDISSYCIADVLARKDTVIELSDEFFTLGTPFGTFSLIIENVIVELINKRWAASNKGRMAR